MKHLLTILLFLLPCLAYGDETGFPVYEDPDDPSDPVENPMKKRMPPRPVMCTIDFTACKVTLSNGVSSGEIVEYEIADCEGCPLMQFAEESSFVSSLSTLPSDDYMIRFRLPDRTLSGYVTR